MINIRKPSADHYRKMLNERLRMLCQCDLSQNPYCNAIPDGSHYREPLADFLRGYRRYPFCARWGNLIMKGGIFKGRRYCWQHYYRYAICDARHKLERGWKGFYAFPFSPNDSATHVYLWEYHPKRKSDWEEHGELMMGPEWPIDGCGRDSDWAKRLINSGQWLPLEGKTWLCEACRDALAKRLARANLKRRKNLIKQAKALKKGKEIHTWLRKYLKERRQRGA